MDSPAQSARVAASVLKAFEKTVSLNGYEFSINMSIGISHYPVDGQTTKQLMKNADVAMYEAKKRGSNKFQFYERRLTERVAERLEFEKDLSSAIENNELVLQCQPCMNLTDGSIEAVNVGMEWHHPVRGRVEAALFYQGITNSHLLMPILQWQIQQCAQLQQVWRMRGYPDTRLRIYVDHRQLFNKELFKYLAMATSDAKDGRYDIELVIGEATLSQQMDLAKRLLVQCQHQGFKTGIHFRAIGFLPVRTLQDCRLSSLTLSHSEDTLNLDTPARNELISGIQKLTDAINIQLIVSDIDSKHQKELYLEQNVAVMSGSYFADYMSATEFEKVLQRFPSQTDSAEPNIKIG
jgi:predicted signal transduction protein with EAL and GGDEF domain